jgi:hypothetical protein
VKVVNESFAKSRFTLERAGMLIVERGLEGFRGV